MNWFTRRRPRAYSEPLNRAWTPDAGEEIERRYTPQIIAFEARHRTARQDYSAEQWQRKQAWCHALEAGAPWRRLLFVRALVDAGRLSDWLERGGRDGH